MFGNKKNTKTITKQIEMPSSILYEELGVKESIDSAMRSFKLVNIGSYVRDDDLVLKEEAENIDNLHIRTDFIIHPVSAIRKTNDGRFSVEAIKSERIDDLINLYCSERWSKLYLGETRQRYLTSDGWELFTVKGEEILEAQSVPYEQCETCHEVIGEYFFDSEREVKPEIYRWNHLRELRTFKIKTPLQMLLKNTGMAITKIQHPCYHSLQYLLRPSQAKSVDPPSLKVVFPENLEY
jgi:hypothetical protein